MIVTTADKPVASKQKKDFSSTSLFLLPETEGSNTSRGSSATFTEPGVGGQEQSSVEDKGKALQ